MPKLEVGKRSTKLHEATLTIFRVVSCEFVDRSAFRQKALIVTQPFHYFRKLLHIGPRAFQ